MVLRHGLLIALGFSLAGCTQPATENPLPAATSPGPALVQPVLATEKVGADADDPAIWVHPTQPELSLIIGTNKEEGAAGALVVYGLDGKTLQRLGPLDRPNNVDIEQNVRLGNGMIDIAVVTERLRRCLRVYRIDGATRQLSEITIPGGIPVFDGEQGEAAAPMGIGLYRRADGAVFAVVGRKTGPAKGYLWQYRLEDDGTGHVRGSKIREFGSYNGGQEIESIAVDDELGYVYYSDETFGIHKYHADPDHPDAARELALFAERGFRGDHEGIAIYKRPDGTGYIVATDQLPNDSECHVFRREGEPGNPHDHSGELGAFRAGADDTDGIEVSSASLGPRFPNGLFVAMNSKDANFVISDWRQIEQALSARASQR